jgi:dipeptidyl aminopeptidase/acylaminoacyl peptidase
MTKGSIAVLLCLLAAGLMNIPPAGAVEKKAIEGLDCTRQSDVIYHRKHGVALTMDVIYPKKQNGAAVIYAVSSGFNSHHRWIEGAGFARNMSMLLDRGYTVFLVVHGSTPKYTIRETYADIRRSIRFIRYNAKSYGIDSDRIGMSGASAGGVISLMMAAAPQEGNPKARDPIDRVSTRLQAIACFYPASDLMNFQKEGENVLKIAAAHRHAGSYQFRDHDPKTNSYKLITDPKRIAELLADNSPITHVSAGDSPTLIVHGEKDRLVPLLQASKMVDALKAVGVKSKLVVAKGKGHGWRDMWKNEMKHIADWFDVHLAPKKKETKNRT